MSHLDDVIPTLMVSNSTLDRHVIDNNALAGTAHNSEVLGIVLAGGLSSRMKVDKSRLIANNMSNLDRAIHLLTSCGLNEVVISGHAPGQIPDTYQQGGPLSGILSVIVTKKPTAVLVIPIDMPLLDTHTLNTVLTQGIAQDSACCFDAHSLPIYLPITDQLVSFLTKEFSSERFSVHHKGPSFKHLLKHIGCHVITQPDSHRLSNANTPQQWQAIKPLIE